MKAVYFLLSLWAIVWCGSLGIYEFKRKNRIAGFGIMVLLFLFMLLASSYYMTA